MILCHESTRKENTSGQTITHMIPYEEVQQTNINIGCRRGGGSKGAEGSGQFQHIDMSKFVLTKHISLTQTPKTS